MIHADIILKADHVLKMDSNLTTIARGAVAVKDGRIAAVGPEDYVCQKYSSGSVIGGAGRVLFPGLVNSHTHAAMVYFRGLGDDLPLKVWLEEHIWPAEEKWLSVEFVSDAAELACIEMLKAGITLYNDMYFHGDAIAAATKRLGMRAVVCAGILDFPSKTASTPEEYLRNAESFIRGWQEDELIRPGIAPHSPYACGPDTLRKAKQLSEKYNAPLHIHLSETEWEFTEILKRHGKTPVLFLDELGFLDQSVVAAHCVRVTSEEIETLGRRRVSVAHCIESNMKLASGIAPVVEMLSAGVKVTFGTDGAASNNDLNILSEMSTAAKVHKAFSGDPTVLDAKTVVLMATRWGAEALGLGELTGSIEEGKAADIVIADLTKPHLTPIYDVYSHMVYAMRPSDIETVVVNGRILVQDGKLTAADETEIVAKASAWGKKIMLQQ